MNTITIDAQRLRTLTTGRLHTMIDDVYKDLQTIYGEEGFMTHMLPNLLRAAEPWLRTQGLDPRFWNGAHDPSHTGTVTLPVPSERDRAEMWERCRALPHPFSR